YVIWSIGYQNTSLTASGVYAIWRTVVDSAAAALSAPLGLSGQTATDPRGTLLTFGFPLLLAAGGLLWWRGRRLGPWPTRAFALGAVLMTFWILIALERSTLGVSALAGRYLEVDALFALLLASELGRGLILRRSLAVALGVITAAALIANVGILRIGAAFLRVSATSVRAGLTGLSIARASVSPAYVSPILPAYPIVRIRAGAYFAMERAIGTPAYTVRQLAGAPLGVRSITDIQLVALGDIRVLTAPASASFGLAPSPAASSGMTVRRQGACLLARPWGPTTGPGGARLVLPVPRGGLLVKTTAPARVGVWRFGIGPHNLAAPSTASDFVVRARPDAAARPWRLVLQTSGAATICGLGGT
ncbi:MAG TPA: hypothetical protein VE983_02610, partial [Solirubrobacteraceae bacterium]|nr:hypothetical protein [Solirubrobacteraceae bacterium]